MSKITTEDCKDFLISHFKNIGHDTLVKDWKRGSKYKRDNIVMRDFNHPLLGIVVVAEDNGVLSIDGTVTPSNQPVVKVKSKKDEYVQRDFTEKEKKEAADLILQYINRDEDGDSDEEDNVEKLLKSKKWINYQHALPSQFYFCFPTDTYNNEKDSVVNGIDTPMVFDGQYSKESFCILFTDKSESDIDLYASNILKNGILPEWSDFCDEYHLDFSSDAPQMTVRECFKMLLEMGFEYKSENDSFGDDCLFGDELNKLKVVKSLTIGKEKDKVLKLDAQIKSILKKDDVVALNDLISNGLDINIKVSGGDYLISMASQEKASKCVLSLLDAGVDLWKSINGNYCVGSQIILRKTEDLTLLLGYMEKQLPTDNIVDKLSVILDNVNYLSEKKDDLELVMSFMKRILSDSEISQVVLNEMGVFLSYDKNLLKETILNADEINYKNALVRSINDKNLISWALSERSVDIRSEQVNGKTVLENLQEDLDNVMERIERSRRGFQMVIVHSDGRREYELDTLTEKYKQALNLLSQVERTGYSDKKPKMK